jgi:putative membrane protein
MFDGLVQIQNGLDKTIESDGETGLIEGMTALKSGIAAYTDGVSQVDGGVSQVSNGLVQLGDGISTASAGIDRLYAGTQQLVANNKKINSGAAQLDDGAVQLYDGSLQLYDGSLQIDDGCDKLMAGANTLETSLRDGATQIEETNTGESAADMFSQPVEAEETFQRTINSNGEAMSAYMMCAGLWVACLAFCLMFSPFKTSLKSRKTFINHGFIALFVSTVAPTIMVTLIMAIDGMRPAHVLETYIMAILASVAFMSIVYFLNTLLDSIGSFLLLILLCLNLSGSAGTYPINLSPKFYQIIHPFMPFTYGVDAFRSTISTGNSLTKDIIVFISISIVCMLLTCLTYEIRRIRLLRQNNIEEQIAIEEELDYYNTQTV